LFLLTDSKSFCKILNSIRDEKKNDSNSDITLNSLCEHFNRLNVNDLDEDKNELNFDFDNMPEADMLLNGSIAEDEIKRVISV
jgi:hypothetical protein